MAGLFHYLAMLYWLLLIPYQWHRIPIGPGAGWLALSAFMATFTATWVWLVGDPRIPIPNLKTVARTSINEDETTWLRRATWALSAAITWVGLEMLIARIFTGFPWDLLGVSQHQNLPLIQISAWTGVYGVSFLIIWGSAALLSACLMLLAQPHRRSVYVGEIALPLLAVSVALALGFHELRQGGACRPNHQGDVRPTQHSTNVDLGPRA